MKPWADMGIIRQFISQMEIMEFLEIKMSIKDMNLIDIEIWSYNVFL